MKKNATPNIKQDSKVFPDEAADILGVALGYCLKAGIPMTYKERDGKLWLSFGGLGAVPLPSGKLEIVARITDPGNGTGNGTQPPGNAQPPTPTPAGNAQVATASAD